MHFKLTTQPDRAKVKSKGALYSLRPSYLGQVRLTVVCIASTCRFRRIICLGLGLGQGRIQDFGKGGSGKLLTKMCHIRAHARDIFPSF